MPSQVITQVIKAGYQQCSFCDELEECYMLTLLVAERCVEQTDPACTGCLTNGVELSTHLKVSDVLDTQRKSRRRGINKRATKRERACAEQIGGRTTPGSGSGIAKGDARNEEWMIDDKFTTGTQTFPVTRTDLIKAVGQAAQSGRKAALKVGFPDFNVAVLSWEDFLELICEN